MTDRPLRSGTTGYQFTDPDRPAPELDLEEAAFACEQARRVYLEVLGPRLEREADEQARGGGESPTRSRFL